MLEFVKYLSLAVVVLPQLVEAVRKVEALVTAAQAGAWKKQLVLDTVNAALAVADDFLALDKVRIVGMVDKLIDVVVAVLNALGEFRHGETANPTPAA